jgi:hypothetical protein
VRALSYLFPHISLYLLVVVLTNKKMMKVTSLQHIVFVIAVSFTLGHVPT